jgi:hypothetical protein
MTVSKPWYLSRTIWASIITVMTGGAGLFGIPTGMLDNGALTCAYWSSRTTRT